MSRDEGKYQVRYDGGALSFYDDLDTALAHEGGFDKVSWTEGEGRIILRGDGTWERWTEASLLNMAKSAAKATT
jgi:hypothetical protein